MSYYYETVAEIVSPLVIILKNFHESFLFSAKFSNSFSNCHIDVLIVYLIYSYTTIFALISHTLSICLYRVSFLSLHIQLSAIAFNHWSMFKLTHLNR